VRYWCADAAFKTQSTVRILIIGKALMKMQTDRPAGDQTPSSRRSLAARVLEGQVEPSAVNELSILDFEVQLRDFADAKLAQAFARRLNGISRRIIPGILTCADQLDYPVDTHRPILPCLLFARAHSQRANWQSIN
jgi:hypothetical protein